MVDLCTIPDLGGVDGCLVQLALVYTLLGVMLTLFVQQWTRLWRLWLTLRRQRCEFDS